MNARINRSTDNREDRHSFCSAVDARPPILTKQEQNRGDQRTGVTDTDPKHKVDNRPSPENWVHVPPDPDPFVDQKSDEAKEHQRGRRGHPEKNPPNPWLGILCHSADHIGDRRVGLVAGDQRRTTPWNFTCVVNFPWIVGTWY